MVYAAKVLLPEKYSEVKMVIFLDSDAVITENTLESKYDVFNYNDMNKMQQQQQVQKQHQEMVSFSMNQSYGLNVMMAYMQKFLQWDIEKKPIAFNQDGPGSSSTESYLLIVNITRTSSYAL